MARKRRTEAGAQAESDLRYWGFHVGKQFAADGYPENNLLLALLCGHSDLNPLAELFGVSVKDVPGDAWDINAVIMRLRSELRGVLIARYCLPMDYETGHPIPARIIADALTISVGMYYRRLDEARDKFASFRDAGPGVRIAEFGACAESTT